VSLRLEPAALVGEAIRLEPYQPGLKDELAKALDVDPEAWSVLSASGQGAAFEAWWSAALAEADRGERIAYAIRSHATGALIGTTSFLDIRPAHRTLEIGATFLRPEARGGRVNPEMKRLMLACAFAAGAVRVQIVTDARNLRSQAAIEKLGATREGVLRNHKITWTGHVRDTVVYAITDAEWPAVKASLDARLA
jgi:RimJ/RimL family protein N-acetyltransferase